MELILDLTSFGCGYKIPKCSIVSSVISEPISFFVSCLDTMLDHLSGHLLFAIIFYFAMPLYGSESREYEFKATIFQFD